MKICKSCGEQKELENFRKNSKTEDKKNHICNECISESKYDRTERRDEQQQDFIKALQRAGGNVTYACKSVNVSRQTYYNWMNEFDDFKKEVDDVRESLIDMAESVLLKEIKDARNITATIFFLKTVGRERGYVERQEMEIDGDMNLQVQFIE